MAASLKSPLATLYQDLKSTENGLSSDQANERLSQYGLNDTHLKKKNPLLADILEFFANPLVIILLFAAGVSAVTGDPIDASIIAGVILMSVALNVFQTYKSRQAVAKLQAEMSTLANVIRDGETVEIDKTRVVPGDVVKVSAGDLVPADCRLITATDLHVQQAMLTGEAMPVNMVADPNQLASDDPAATTACVFQGSSVVSGYATALVVNTGRSTVFGDIAVRLAAKAPETEFDRGLRKFGQLILRTVIFLVLFVFLSTILRHHESVSKKTILDALLFSIALAVGLTPEFLPMITTITLSRGAVHMAKRNVIVKNLRAIQNFGSMDILCSDKTGTLTTGEMVLGKHVGPNGEEGGQALQLAILNSKNQSGIKNSLDDAIISAAPKDQTDFGQKVREIPFDFERRKLSVVVKTDGKTLLITKGAPESIIADCDLAAISNIPDAMSADGYRVLAVAYKEIEEKEQYSEADEKNMTLAGYLGFYDPPLPDALHALTQLKHTGVIVKIITGDNQLVAQHVCKEVGLESGEIILGSEIEKMSDAALQHIAESNTVFARVSPAQKNRIILALKQRGHVVGYMGDGVNDAPSLHAADVGISFATAVDVAKDSAEIVLKERGLNVLKDGILEGRMAFGNVMKYLLMGTSSNFGNMFSMAAASMFLPFLPMLPTQILLNNFMYDLSQVTIPTDAVDRSYIRKPKHWDVKLIRDFMIYIGPISSLYDFLTFYVLIQVLGAKEKEFHTGWFVESLATQILVIFIIRTAGNPLKSRPSKALTITTLLIVGLAFLLPYSPLSNDLGFVSLPPLFFGYLVFAVLTYLGLVELVKRRLFVREAP